MPCQEGVCTTEDVAQPLLCDGSSQTDHLMLDDILQRMQVHVAFDACSHVRTSSSVTSRSPVDCPGLRFYHVFDGLAWCDTV